MITATNLTKHYGDRTFSVRPGCRHRLPGSQGGRHVQHHADDHLVVVGRGRLLATVSEMRATANAGSVRVVTPFATKLRDRVQVVVHAHGTSVVRPPRSPPG